MLLVSIPRLQMRKAMNRSVSVSGLNSFLHWPAVTSDSRNVVKPSPELNYSVAVIDLSNGPLEIILEQCPEVYCSVSLYAPNSDNFQVMNCDGLTRVHLCIYRKEKPGYLGGQTVKMVKSHAVRAVLVVRSICAEKDSSAKSMTFRIRCPVLSSAA
jgi:uncharacterized membrane protein